MTCIQVYDTDGNILQAIDDHMLPLLITSAFSSNTNQSSFEITELGCGTGRNTAKLITPGFLPSQVARLKINALDLSKGMLKIADERCSEIEGANMHYVDFQQFDALQPEKYKHVIEALSGTADMVISTLVLEHLPVDIFFSIVKKFLGPGGILLMTNMHSEMGGISQAGFVDEKTGEKIQGTSYAHTIQEVLQEARNHGFELIGEMLERGIEESDIASKVVGQRGRKWVGVKVWFGGVLRRSFE